MQVVVVSSPGQGRASHWSHELAAELAAIVAQHGGRCRWLAAVHDAQPAPAAGRAPDVSVLRCGPLRPVSSVAANHRHAALELALTRELRDTPLAVVVHVGVGARGSPNVLWLAERLGSRTVACLRGAELVCSRGDLVDRDGRPCSEHDDPERCRWCCTTAWWRRPRANDIRNRADLLLAGLLTAEVVLVPVVADVALVTGLGVAERRVAIGSSADDVLARLLPAPRLDPAGPLPPAT